MAFPDGQVRAGLGGEAVPQGRTPPLRDDRNGVFGPFEDLITLLVVIVAIVILIASIALALSNVRDDANRARFLNGTHNFASSLRSYGNLTHEGAEGVFDGAKVTSLNWTQLGNDFAPDHLGFFYNVSIVDVSDYPSRGEYSRSNYTPFAPPTSSERATVYSSVAIWAGPSEIHEAQLAVTCWRL